MHTYLKWSQILILMFPSMLRSLIFFFVLKSVLKLFSFLWEFVSFFHIDLLWPPVRSMCVSLCLIKARATGIRADVWPFSDMAPRDRAKYSNVPDASQRETDRQPLVGWMPCASWHHPVSVKCLCICVCVCAHFSAWHAVVAWLRSHAVRQHVIWTGLLNILMVPLTDGSRPEQLSTGAQWPPVLSCCLSRVLNALLLSTPVISH